MITKIGTDYANLLRVLKSKGVSEQDIDFFDQNATDKEKNYTGNSIPYRHYSFIEPVLKGGVIGLPVGFLSTLAVPHEATVRYIGPALGAASALAGIYYFGNKDKEKVDRINNILSKTASDLEDEYNKLPASVKTVLGIYLSGKGIDSITDAYNRGYLTGRATLFHGTKPIKDKILEEGLVPSTDNTAGITKAVLKEDLPDIYEKSLGKVYTTDSKRTALGYAKNNPEGLIEINAPTWKMNTVNNPETDMSFKEWEDKMLGGSKLRKRVKGAAIKNSWKLLRDSTVFNQVVPPEYIMESSRYIPNSKEEIFDYIKNNKIQFTKGLGKAIGGSGLSLAGLYAMLDAYDKYTPDIAKK